MKTLIFTHKNDIDGVGCAILAKIAYFDVEFVLCETFELKTAIDKYFDDGSIYSFERIFVTDLWPKDETISKFICDEKLKDKFFIFDHHKTSLDSPYSKESFATVKISDEKGLCCGTSLFYKYLVEQNLIEADNSAIIDFVELTRRHDTWEWKNIYNDEKSRELSLLFDAVGCSKYIEMMYSKLTTRDYFYFTETERCLIDIRIENIKQKTIEYANNIQYKEILGLKAGILYIEYSYRNEIAEYFRENNFDMDFVVFIVPEKRTISYRSIKDGVNVRVIAEHFGGKGHDKASTNPISDEKMKALLETLIS